MLLHKLALTQHHTLSITTWDHGGPGGLCHNDSPHQENEWVMCSNKTLLTKPGTGQDLAVNCSLPTPARDLCFSNSNMHRNSLGILWEHKFWLDGSKTGLRFYIYNSLQVDVNTDSPWPIFWVVRLHRFLCEPRDWNVTSSITGALYWVFIELRKKTKQNIFQAGTCLLLL